MKIKFEDNFGTQETIYFNPGIVFYPDGSIIVLESEAYDGGEKFTLPMFAGNIKELWVNIRDEQYGTSTLNMKPGTFKALWSEGNTVHFVRWKEQSHETRLQKLKKRFL